MRSALTTKSSRSMKVEPLADQEGVRMLSRCANSQCSKPFLRLREGKLFLVETEGLARLGSVKSGLTKLDSSKAGSTKSGSMKPGSTKSGSPKSGSARSGLTKSGEPVSPVPGRARQLRQIEHFWLCGDCATRWTLAYDQDCGVLLAPLRRPVASVPAAPASSLSAAG
jgi:hypothetical protein